VRRKLIIWTFLFSDFFVFTVSIYVAMSFFQAPRGWISLPEILNTNAELRHVLLTVTIYAIWLLSIRQFGLYENRHLLQLVRPKSYTLALFNSTLTGTALVSILLFVADVVSISLSFIILLWCASFFTIYLCRKIMCFFIRRIRIKGRNIRFILIVGTNDRALHFARRIHGDSGFGYRLLGFVDDNVHIEGSEMDSLGEVVCGVEDFGDYLKNNVVDEVVISLPLASCYFEASRMVKICEELGIVVIFFSGVDFLNAGSSKAVFNILHGENVITILPPSMRGWQLTIKRIMDFVISFILILLLLPLFVIIGILIKWNSPGPALFIQERVGLNKRKFRLMKFRTMIADAETQLEHLGHLNEVEGAAFKITDDPRVTPIGNYLRRSSLDELPQLLNVLMGDMSLVGPRPLPLRDFAGFDQDWHYRRFSVRPGITCLWQIGGRSSISFDRWMELDMEYIDNWSLKMDIEILFQTIPAVLSQRGAV
jgi:exopolysaccharide biosynthesis polyprenyl glycosylphosphotransferase